MQYFHFSVNNVSMLLLLLFEIFEKCGICNYLFFLPLFFTLLVALGYLKYSTFVSRILFLLPLLVWLYLLWAMLSRL